MSNSFPAHPSPATPTGKASNTSDEHGRSAAVPRVITVALCGNPNAGKSTIFNYLTGLRQKVANYPGVTVESRRGRLTVPSHPECVFDIIDVPGCYSLAALSPDEFIATQSITGRSEAGLQKRPDALIVVLDAANLDRSMYILAQVAEAGIPIIVTLNMVDVAEAQGKRINVVKLAKILGAPVVSAVANRGRGLDRLKEKIATCQSLKPPARLQEFDTHVESFLQKYSSVRDGSLSRPELIRAVFDRHGPAEKLFSSAYPEGVKELEELRVELTQEYRGLPFAEAYPLARSMASIANEVTIKRTGGSDAISDKLDGVVLHRVWGPLILALVMLGLFQSIFTWASPVMAYIDSGVSSFGAIVGSLLSEGALRSLIVDGVIGGVGAVVTFLPQILILFLLLGILEDSGYLPRAAFIVDRLFKWCGLSGKSFVPLLSSFACAIPGIMATRVIESKRQRFLTILVAPLMSCSARLPVYALMIGAFVPYRRIFGVFNTQGLTMVALYCLGTVVAIIVALIMSRTVLRGKQESFVMELPSYKLPTLRGLWTRTALSGAAFLRRAGTVIFAIAILVWALSYFPRNPEIVNAHNSRVATITQNTDSSAREAALETENRQVASELLRDSYFGRAGRALEPYFAPLGWDWRITMAALASFPAREVVVATLGIIYNIGSDVEESSESLITKMRGAVWDTGEHKGAPVFNMAVALSIMVFFALCCQCGATVATIRRETHSGAWAVFAFCYMTALAYIGAFVTYRIFFPLGI